MSRTRFALVVVAVLVVVAGISAAWLLARDESRRAIAPASVDVAALSPAEHTKLVDRGRYVARAANCEGCHLTPDSVPYAGGMKLETPLGAIYGTNITPSRTHGIGEYSADDLYRSLVLGVVPGGRRLYPAMPYPSYHAISRANSDAVHAYLMSLPPIDKPNRPPELGFPFSYRPFIAFWNLLYRPRPEPHTDVAGRTPEWNRGRYLVETLGHCGECHTPRNFAYAMRRDQHLEGFVIENALSPDMTSVGLKRNGWSKADLIAYMGQGLSPQGTPNFRMYQVLDTSTRYLTQADLAAIATYLLDNPSTSERTRPAQPEATASAADIAAGRDLYMGLCAGCHGDQHFDRPGVAVSMRANTSVRNENPLNFVRVIREGIGPRDLPDQQRRQRMPAYPGLSDQEVAQILNYIRATWGGAHPSVSSRDVAEARAEK